jgi:cellulose synthase/poly-beta-1,6-N-acetylglucosamine synthase-like glycosyltransferase
MTWLPQAQQWLLAAYVGVLVVLSVYGLHRVVLLSLLRRYPDPVDTESAPAVPDSELPVVTVQLPIFNERYVVDRLVDAVAGLDWPLDRLEIQVLDDSTDDTEGIAQAAASRWRARGRDIQVIHRTDRVGYKAGALEAGLATARGELVAVFDADFVPPADFLRRTVPQFAPGVGMVQARWGHLNDSESGLTRGQAILLDGHFVVEHGARFRSGRWFNFNGTAGIWRPECIRDAGGWQHDTLTEDLDLSYRAQLAGWRFVYVAGLAVSAELPRTMCAFKTQQHRWAKGSIQTALKLLPVLLRAPIGWRIKAESFVHLTSNLAYPLVLVLSVLMVPAALIRPVEMWHVLGVLDIFFFGAATLSIAAFYGVSQQQVYLDWRRRALWIPAVMSLGLGMAVNQTRAVFEALAGQSSGFVRTPKSGSAGSGGYRATLHWTVGVELALACWFLGGLILASAMGRWTALPFLALFGAGFAWVGLQSLDVLRSDLRTPGAAGAAG